ncbi:MAG: PD40 domain-containing protein [Verrucomicrobiales bacterium]|nr:PD40 domain-containing protein [Verrucomicrobiales bacterium]
MCSPFDRLVGTVAVAVTLLGGAVGAAFAAGPAELLERFRQGPLGTVDAIVFAARGVNPTDGHWYANFGYYAHDPDRKAYTEGAKLYRFDLKTRALEVLVQDPRGGIRDPQLHYGGRRILFSYRPGGTENYHLYELDLDGRETGQRPAEAVGTLRQITSGPYDDIEPSYLPDGGIVFVSSRCKRWVNCWLTQVAVLHRCEMDGSNLRALSSNNEHDNTPWPLPDGRILYTRWEYVDRSQVHFHHLWAMNPDGTGQSVWFGNLHPGTTMIDAKPIPNSHKIVASFSPGHGQREHDGVVTVVDPKAGPDAAEFARPIGKAAHFRDPWAFSEDCFLAASRDTVVLIDGKGVSEVLVRLPESDRAAKMECHEPRPIAPRPTETVVQSRTKPELATGRYLVADVHQGRRMDGVAAGEIRKLLVLETLPMPIHYTGGMEPISYGGTFTLERILGTVPVESDGSAYFEAPAMRSVFFVALDEHDLAVKRMQSFTTVQPGEMLSCVGCHEHRAQTPRAEFHATLAVRKPAAKIEPFTDVPDVFDYPRDVQPVLDALCVDCHGTTATARGGPRAGRLLLTGDRGPLFSHSYYMMTIARLVADGRNQPVSNYQPRTLGSSASRLLKFIDGSHYGVRADERQSRILRLWIESGAAYPGTYAALGCGMIGNYAENVQINLDTDWSTTRAGAEVLQRRCAVCHKEPSRLLPLSLVDERGVSFWQPSMDDPRLLTSRHIVFNLTQPEKSMLLLAPLDKSAGGWGLCRGATSDDQPGRAVFTTARDRDYETLLAMIAAGRDFLEKDRRFDMPDFRPRQDWVREMKRYGILPPSTTATQVTNVYEVEQTYWRSLWHLAGPDVASHATSTSH